LIIYPKSPFEENTPLPEQLRRIAALLELDPNAIRTCHVDFYVNVGTPASHARMLHSLCVVKP